MNDGRCVSIDDLRALVRRHAADEADAWLDAWLRTWVPALAARPVDLLSTDDGRERVLLVLRQGLTGVYA
jgi:hypothetical protein